MGSSGPTAPTRQGITRLGLASLVFAVLAIACFAAIGPVVSAVVNEQMPATASEGQPADGKPAVSPAVSVLLTIFLPTWAFAAAIHAAVWFVAGLACAGAGLLFGLVGVVQRRRSRRLGVYGLLASALALLASPLVVRLGMELASR